MALAARGDTCMTLPLLALGSVAAALVIMAIKQALP